MEPMADVEPRGIFNAEGTYQLLRLGFPFQRKLSKKIRFFLAGQGLKVQVK